MTSESDLQRVSRNDPPESIEMPAPTPWPLVLALGLCLLAAGMVTNVTFSLLGVALCIAGGRGWIGDVSPRYAHVHEPLVPEAERAKPVRTAPEKVQLLQPGMHGHRMRIPEKVHPYSAGIAGGAVGGVVIALIAMGYGVVSGRGIWYPINLLAAMAIPSFDIERLPELEQFQLSGLLVATLIHVVSSLLLGLLYGLLLPMLPRRPILWGGVIAPLIWTGLLHGALGILNPVLSAKVDWPWFIASQFAFGLVVGLWVVRTEKVYSSQLWSGAERS